MRGVFCFLYFFLFSLAAASETCCICEASSGPAIEKPFFSAGCDIWLSKQKGCSAKVKRLYTGVESSVYSNGSSPYDPFRVPQECVGMKNILLSYVGHWDSTQDSVEKLYRNIIPTMAEKKINFEIHNTACLAMSSPDLFVSALKNKVIEIPKGLRLSYRGHQALSVGMWHDGFPFLESYNIDATWDSTTNKIRYPSCNEYVGRDCNAGKRKGRSVLCELNSKIHAMTCSMPKSKPKFSSFRGSSSHSKKWSLVSDPKRMNELMDYRASDFLIGQAYLHIMTAKSF